MGQSSLGHSLKHEVVLEKAFCYFFHARVYQKFVGDAFLASVQHSQFLHDPHYVIRVLAFLAFTTLEFVLH